MKKTALIISFTDLERDPRVNRQIQLLKEYYDLTLCGVAPPRSINLPFVDVSGEDHCSLPKKILTALRLKFRFFAGHYWSKPHVRRALRLLENQTFDLIIGNDIVTAPLVERIKGSAKAVIDLHEYAPEEFSDRFLWRQIIGPYHTWLCSKYLPKADGLLTVCKPIAERYAKMFGVREPFVFENMANFMTFEPQPVGEKIRLIHHGISTPSRRIELMIDAVGGLPRFELDLMMIPSSAAYHEMLTQKANGYGNIRLIPPVDRTQIVPLTNRYDIGLFLLPPVNYNYENALPNKFFEFIQARLAIGIGPSPAMKGYLDAYQNGFVSSEFTAESLREALQGLDREQIQRMKENSAKAAPELCFERRSRDLIQYLRDL